jgi:hypothetical protein
MVILPPHLLTLLLLLLLLLPSWICESALARSSTGPLLFRSRGSPECA